MEYKNVKKFINSQKNWLEGFTLAEVLITLGVIGIVAAMTLPTVINKHQERVTVARVKKFYSVMNQALLFAIKDNGYVNDWSFVEYDEDNVSRSDKFVSYIKPYLHIAKFCGSESGCISATYKNLKGTTLGTDYDKHKRYSKMILNDGSYLWIRNSIGSDSVNSSTECNATDAGVKNVCRLIWLDINGKKEPNTLGRDVFVFFILKDRIIPHGNDDCNGKSTGWGCSGYILQHDNMKYFYK